MSRPRYFDKHPCVACGTGYGECAQGAVMSLMCCKSCDHPTVRQPNPWSDEDRTEFAEINARRNA